MNWLLAIILSVVIASFGAIFQKMFLVRSKCSSLAFSVLFQLFMGISFLLVCIFIIRKPLYVPASLIPNIILDGVLYSIINVCVFKSLETTSASKFAIIFSSRAFFSVVGFVLILHQPIEVKLILGGVLVVIGIVLANKNGLKISFGRGELLALAAGIVFGFANVNDKAILSQMNLYQFLAVVFLLEGTISAIIFSKDTIKIPRLFKKETLSILLPYLLFNFFGTITYFLALQIAPQSSPVVLINLVCVILTVVLGILILKEKEGVIWKIIGAIIAIGGLVLLS